MLVCARPTRASVALLLEQPYGGMGAVNPTGHSALYFDHICAETPIQVRTCRPGELGTVISRYNDIGGYDWIAVPLLPYLYAVESPERVPTSVDPLDVSRLRNTYRRAHLLALAPEEEGHVPPGNWYELVGSAYDRTIYGFQVNSTPEQDERLIALLNDRKNIQRYNGAFRNCADFVRVTVNRFYPHAIRRNFIADLGLSTPKSVARSLTRYAAKHPELGLQAFVIPQVKGSLPRSHRVQGVTESLLKKYGVPLTFISPAATGVVLVAYLGRGRFDMPEDAPVLDLSAAADPDLPRNVAPLEVRILLASAGAPGVADGAATADSSSSLPSLIGGRWAAPARMDTPAKPELPGASGVASFPVPAAGAAMDPSVPASSLPLFQ